MLVGRDWLFVALAVDDNEVVVYNNEAVGDLVNIHRT